METYHPDPWLDSIENILCILEIFHVLCWWHTKGHSKFRKSFLLKFVGTSRSKASMERSSWPKFGTGEPRRRSCCKPLLCTILGMISASAVVIPRLTYLLGGTTGAKLSTGISCGWTKFIPPECQLQKMQQTDRNRFLSFGDSECCASESNTLHSWSQNLATLKAQGEEALHHRWHQHALRRGVRHRP